MNSDVIDLPSLLLTFRKSEMFCNRNTNCLSCVMRVNEQCLMRKLQNARTNEEVLSVCKEVEAAHKRYLDSLNEEDTKTYHAEDQV